MTQKLTQDFFQQPTLLVAEKLLGKRLVFYDYSGIIIEIESYIGGDDPACHAFKGRTKRTEVMYGQAGRTYVYLIYGMYHCLNFVTEKEGFPSAVLIRGIQMDDGTLLDGPGKLCKYMSITREHNNLDITNNDNFYLENNQSTPQFTKTPRIGISKGTDKPWRYIVS